MINTKSAWLLYILTLLQKGTVTERAKLYLISFAASTAFLSY